MATNSAARNPRTDQLLATVLKYGGLIALAFIALGTVLALFHSKSAVYALRLGVLALMATPVLRIALAIFAFSKERDYKYALIATAVLLIVLLGAVLRIAG
jgi:uncharacterized membrane protein